MRNEDLADLTAFLGELQAESDRGLALVGASVIDDKLRASLESFFVEGGPASKLLDAGNAPLGTFSSRTDACFALGLIDQFEYREISLVRKVRNEFAHGLHGLGFDTEPVRDYCANLESPLPEGSGHPIRDPRFRFTNAVISLVARLYYRAEWVAKERRMAKEWVATEDLRWRSFSDEPPPEGSPILGVFKARDSGVKDEAD